MNSAQSRYHGHRFPPDIIGYAVWVYHRFCLSFRDVEDLLAERGIIVSYETIRKWCWKFGSDYTLRLNKGSGANTSRIRDDGQMPGFVAVEELFKGRQFDREIVVLCVRWYLSFKLNFRDLVAMMGERGIGKAHTMILQWVQHYLPEFEWRCRRYVRPVGPDGGFLSQPEPGRKRRQIVSPHCDEAVREMRADGELPCRVQVRSSRYLNNLIEQDHRRVKQRISSILGFKRFDTAVVTISGIELAEKIKKGQFKTGKLGRRNVSLTELWNAARSLNPIAIPQRDKAEPISPAAWFAPEPQVPPPDRASDQSWMNLSGERPQFEAHLRYWQLSERGSRRVPPLRLRCTSGADGRFPQSRDLQCAILADRQMDGVGQCEMHDVRCILRRRCLHGKYSHCHRAGKYPISHCIFLRSL
jgi:transposase-like protein